MTKDSHELDVLFIWDSASTKHRVEVKNSPTPKKKSQKLVKNITSRQFHQPFTAANIHVGKSLPDADLIDSPANNGYISDIFHTITFWSISIAGPNSNNQRRLRTELETEKCLVLSSINETRTCVYRRLLKVNAFS